MIIIPLRSETDVKKLPYLTMGLIVFTLIIWVFTSRTAGFEQKALREIRYEMFKVEFKYIREISQDPSLREQLNESPDDYFRKVMTREDYALWRELKAQHHDFVQKSFFYQWGFKPVRLNPMNILTAMFIHANFFHVFFNMWFLWIVGCNIEDEWGWKVFLIFYVISGFAAAILHVLMNPASTTPCIGASGAIAGVMGAFMIRHFKIKIRFAYYFLPLKPFYGTFAVAAGVWLPIWLMEQFLGAKWSSMTGTAYWAHIGGFVFGSVVGLSSKAFDSAKIPLPAQNGQGTHHKLTSEQLMAMHKSILDGRSGSIIEHLPQVKQVLLDDPQNVTARLIFAKLYFEKGRLRDASAMYGGALNIMMKTNAIEGIRSVYQEVQEKGLTHMLSENTLIRLAMYYEKKTDYSKAVALYHLFIRNYPASSIRPKVLHRTAQILKIRLHNDTAAEKTLVYLKKTYPAFMTARETVSA